ncbi:NAD-dependent epimerase/dehydratase family protein [Desulfovibrio psychrotolerans]|uniref:UDP-sulfoquinovose synthase n=1 Tax=Desulfovibrio psychrotolerans TaxID=415242 RepID=A0A7J0BUB0_9BACT|nr:NAD-dependent epimerase/dehydratase family protein [Desulfovibrio psychrotolerans]GFM37306.1 UDP-sulfoquinovose synthase [Desulfovibrio psychrotolerans]
MNVLILGGDGYLGWPTAMHLSAHGHTVAVVDNYLRRNICREVNAQALYPVPNLHERVRLWESLSGHRIQTYFGDLAQWDVTADVFRDFQPEVVVHYAEQPSAPYSMLDRRSATLTLNNNLQVTANMVFAVREFCPDAHIVKLGTMGEYGTPNIDIEEGWLDVEHKGRSHRFMYPRQASSLYHTTKIMDTDLLWFYVRTWGIRVTDLMQGPVYGVFTQETGHDAGLLPFFNYDELFGTVLNRFVVQAVAGYPLTVYGQGGQTRGYLNLRDTLSCVRLAMENPAERGELKIFNQFTETFSVNQLAEMVCRVGKDMGLGVTVQNLPNPRKELEKHYYNPAHTGLIGLGLEPTLLTDEVLGELMEFVLSHRERIDKSVIFRGVKWA